VTSTITNVATLAQAHAVLNGDFGFTLPWADRGGGVRRRRRISRIWRGAAAGQPGLGARRARRRRRRDPADLGGYNVYEAFGELIVPLASRTARSSTN
jgi:iron complex outermembrane receptor protein